MINIKKFHEQYSETKKENLLEYNGDPDEFIESLNDDKLYDLLDKIKRIDNINHRIDFFELICAYLEEKYGDSYLPIMKDFENDLIDKYFPEA